MIQLVGRITEGLGHRMNKNGYFDLVLNMCNKTCIISSMCCSFSLKIVFSVTLIGLSFASQCLKIEPRSSLTN